MNVTIGIMAYNEEKNIGKLLDAIISQKTKIARIKEIIVVSDGSTDSTNDIVLKKAKKNKKVKLIAHKRRRGKSVVINNFLKNVNKKPDAIILESADTLPAKGSIEKLCSYLKRDIGMVGAHIIPLDKEDNFFGYVSNLIWKLHHEVALQKPKFGELIAFRNIIKRIPKTAVDEEEIASLIKKKGYKLLYAKNALVYNKGPDNLKDFLKQRRRIYAGHLCLKKTRGYSVPTMGTFSVIKALKKVKNKKLIWAFGAVCLEACARILGAYDYYFKKEKHFIWETVESGKLLKPQKD